jgi:hypothetical protein
MSQVALISASGGLSVVFGVVAFGTALLALSLTLAVLLMRERVKQAMYEQGLTPVRVRWRPFAYWSPAVGRGWAFEVIGADAFGTMQSGRFWVSSLRWRVWRIAADAGYFKEPMSGLMQVVYLLTSTLCFGFGIRTLLARVIILPSTRRAPQGVHLYGWSKNLLSAAVLCAAGVLLLHVVYHYSGPSNERKFRRVARTVAATGWVLLWLSFATFAVQLARS